jgi:hypothetical protein
MIDDTQRQALLRGVFNSYYHAIHPTRTVFDTVVRAKWIVPAMRSWDRRPSVLPLPALDLASSTNHEYVSRPRAAARASR